MLTHTTSQCSCTEQKWQQYKKMKHRYQAADSLLLNSAVDALKFPYMMASGQFAMQVHSGPMSTSCGNMTGSAAWTHWGLVLRPLAARWGWLLEPAGCPVFTRHPARTIRLMMVEPFQCLLTGHRSVGLSMNTFPCCCRWPLSTRLLGKIRSCTQYWMSLAWAFTTLPGTLLATYYCCG